VHFLKVLLPPSPRGDLESTGGWRFVAASRSEAYTKLLTFIDTTETYQSGFLPSEGCRDISRRPFDGLTVLISQGSSRPRQYCWDAWVATRMRWRYAPAGYTTISKRKSEHIPYTLRLRTRLLACRYCIRKTALCFSCFSCLIDIKARKAPRRKAATEVDKHMINRKA